MYIKQFSIQKCILAVKLVKNLKKKGKKKPQFKQYHLNYTIHLNPQLQKPKTKTPKKKLTFSLLWLLTVFKASTSLSLIEEFIYNLEIS